MVNSMIDVPDRKRDSEVLVRDYLLYQLQLNLLHGLHRDKTSDEAVENLMDAKREMQEKEAQVVRKFAALNERYALINEVVDFGEVKKIEDFEKMVEENERLLMKWNAILYAFNDDVEAYLADHQARKDEINKLQEEIHHHEEIISSLDAILAAADNDDLDFSNQEAIAHSNVCN